MARQTATVQQIVRGGIVPTMGAAHADGHAIANDGENVFFAVLNGSGSSINVTVQTPNSVDGNAISDKVVAVAAGVLKYFGPYPRKDYNQGNEEIYVDISLVTTITIGFFRL